MRRCNPARAGLLIAVFAFAACSSAPRPEPGWWRTLADVPCLSDEFLARVPPERRGFHGDLRGEPWRAGDELVFGLESWGPDGVEERWVVTLTDMGWRELESVDGRRFRVALEQQLHVTLVPDDPLQSYSRGTVRVRGRTVTARVTELDGSPIAEGNALAYDALHELGMHRYLALDPDERRSREKPDGGDGSAENPFVHALDDPWWRSQVQIELFKSFQRNDALAGLLRRLSASPGFFDLASMLFRPVIVMHVEGNEESASVPAPDDLPWTAPCSFAIPTYFTIGSFRALDVALFVLPPEGPLALSAGVFAIRGRQPESPEHGFALVLLGCRRGEPAAK